MTPKKYEPTTKKDEIRPRICIWQREVKEPPPFSRKPIAMRHMVALRDIR
jgi:hypothetical protein